jgi:hypothetical protein
MEFLFPTAGRFSSLICLAWAKKEPPNIFLESVTNTDGERPSEAVAGGVAGSLPSGRSIRPRNTTADRRKIPSWIGSKKRNFLSGICHFRIPIFSFLTTEGGSQT